MIRSEQTEAIKLRLLNLVKQFVRRYQPKYYVQYRGDIEDLIYSIYTEFLTPKSRDKNKEKESLLDKWNPEITSLEYLTKVSVINQLINRSKSDKREVRAEEKYDEETGTASLDWLYNKMSSSNQDEALENIEFSEEDVKRARKAYQSMDEISKKTFNRRFSLLKKDLSPNVLNFINEVIGSSSKGQSNAFKPFYIFTKANPLFNAAEVQEVPVQGRNCIRVRFLDKSLLSQVTPAMERDLIDFFDDYDYSLYKTSSGIWYFTNTSKYGDSRVKDSYSTFQTASGEFEFEGNDAFVFEQRLRRAIKSNYSDYPDATLKQATNWAFTQPETIYFRIFKRKGDEDWRWEFSSSRNSQNFFDTLN